MSNLISSDIVNKSKFSKFLFKEQMFVCIRLKKGKFSDFSFLFNL